MTDTGYYTEDGRRFDTWKALIESEANGWVAVAILKEKAKRGSLFTMTLGPFPSQREGNNARNRIRAKFHRQERQEKYVLSELVTITVKPAWKNI